MSEVGTKDVGVAPSPGAAAGPLLALRGVRKGYARDTAQVHALDGVDAAFRERELVVVLGPGGSGKTTLLNLLGALDRPGSIR